MKNSREQPSTRRIREITISIAGYVPSKKNRRVLAFGKILPPREFVLWQKEVKRAVLQKTGGSVAPVDSSGPCTVSIRFGMSDLRRRDTDNMVTSWLDALQESGILSDDSWTSVGCVNASVAYSPTPYSVCTVSEGNDDVEKAIRNIKDSRCQKRK